MGDPYFIAIQEQWTNIRGLYMMYERKKPIILYDIQEDKIYAYPYAKNPKCFWSATTRLHALLKG